jgi:hypothetical protein
MSQRKFSCHEIKSRLNLLFYDVVAEIIEYKDCRRKRIVSHEVVE